MTAEDAVTLLAAIALIVGAMVAFGLWRSARHAMSARRASYEDYMQRRTRHHQAEWLGRGAQGVRVHDAGYRNEGTRYHG